MLVPSFDGDNFNYVYIRNVHRIDNLHAALIDAGCGWEPTNGGDGHGHLVIPKALTLPEPMVDALLDYLKFYLVLGNGR